MIPGRPAAIRWTASSRAKPPAFPDSGPLGPDRVRRHADGREGVGLCLRGLLQSGERFIGYLETYTPEFKELLQKSNGVAPLPVMGPGIPLPQGRLVATPDSPNIKWVEFFSGEGQNLLGKAHMRCRLKYSRCLAIPTPNDSPMMGAAGGWSRPDCPAAPR